jgi:hypothetical protein
MVLIAAWSWPPVSARPPSHFGSQLPLFSMNAMVNHLTPVAFVTEVRLGGLPQPV